MAEGCYIPQYAPASFKGFVAEAMTIDYQGGRRGAEGEFPFAERGAYADLGRKLERYKMKFRFARNSHVEDARAFFLVCTSPHAGPLSHPTRGVVQAACKQVSVEDDLIEAQGVSYVNCEFVEAPDWLTGFSFLGGVSLLGFSVSPIVDAVQDIFDSFYDISGVPFFDVPKIHAVVTDAINEVRTVFVNSAGIEPDREVWTISSDLETAANDPSAGAAKIFEALSGGLASIDYYAPQGETKYEAFRSVANWAARDNATDYDAEDVIYSGLRLMAAGYMVRAALETKPRTMQEGIDQYDQVVAIFDEEIAKAIRECAPATHEALFNARIEAQKALLSRAYTLPAITSYNFHGSVPSLVASWEIYCDAKRFREIENYNPQSFPFVVGPTVYAEQPEAA
jgi:prophage DNA circulation protein